MDWVRQDLRLAVRSLLRRPGFSALAILTLAVGLGVNTVAFSAVNALLFKPIQHGSASGGGWLFVGTNQAPLSASSIRAFEAIERDARSLDMVAAEGRRPFAFTRTTASGLDAGTAGIDEAWALVVSSDYFSILGVEPLEGRTLRAGDDGGDGLPVVVSEQFWSQRLGLDREAPLSDAAFSLNGQNALVVGILPDGFQGPGGLFEPDVWVPLEARSVLGLPESLDDDAARWLTMVAQPRADATAEAIEREIGALAESGLLGDDAAEDIHVAYERFADGHPEVRAMVPGALIGLGIVGAVLLIACFNVAGLILARSMERRRDMSVRSALGASRWRLAREILTEGLVFAGAAGVAALILASWTATLLSAFSLPAPIPQRLHFVTDWRLVSFAAGLALLAAIVPALAPVWQVARSDLAKWVRVGGTTDAGGIGQRRTRRAFVLAQVAGSTFFLIVALVFGLSFARTWQMNPGFDTENTAVLMLDAAYYGYEPSEARALIADVADQMRATPGVEAVTIADRISFYVGFERPMDASLDGSACETDNCTRLGSYAIGPDYFRTLDIPLLAGREIDAQSPADVDAVVLSATAAEQLWPGESAVGRAFKTQPDGQWREVVGVAADAVHRGFGETTRPYVYVPLTDEHYGQGLTVVARASTSGAPSSLVARFRQTVQNADPQLPIQSVMTMEDRMALPLWMPRTVAGFFGICGLLAVLLSTVGLFGVTYFVVSQRRREFGVRCALGASARALRALVLRDTLRLAAPGVAVGAIAALIAAAAISSRVTQIEPMDPVAFGGALLVQLVVTLLAGWSPARRAASASPLEVLRAD